MGHPNGNVCPACLGTRVGFDVVSYLSGVCAPDGGTERLTEDQMVCYDCGERTTHAPNRRMWTSQDLMESIGRLIGPGGANG